MLPGHHNRYSSIFWLLLKIYREVRQNEIIKQVWKTSFLNFKSQLILIFCIKIFLFCRNGACQIKTFDWLIVNFAKIKNGSKNVTPCSLRTFLYTNRETNYDLGWLFDWLHINDSQFSKLTECLTWEKLALKVKNGICRRMWRNLRQGVKIWK